MASMWYSLGCPKEFEAMVTSQFHQNATEMLCREITSYMHSKISPCSLFSQHLFMHTEKHQHWVYNPLWKLCLTDLFAMTSTNENMWNLKSANQTFEVANIFAMHSALIVKNAFNLLKHLATEQVTTLSLLLFVKFTCTKQLCQSCATM